MKAFVDQDGCIGCGLCAQVAAQVFQMESDKAIVILEELGEEVIEDAKTAADQCPVDAIKVE